MKNITKDQMKKLEALVAVDVKVNAYWAIPMIQAIANGQINSDLIDSDAIPFSLEDAEKFASYRGINPETNEPYTGEEDDYTSPEFLQCFIVSDRMGRLLEKVGELVIDNRISGYFWFRKTYGQGIEFDSEVQDAFADLL